MTNHIRNMYAALAQAATGSDAGDAYTLVRDCLDMGTIPDEVILQVAIGRETLAGVLRQAADHMIEMADDGDADDKQAAEELAADMRSAALTFDSLGDLV